MRKRPLFLAHLVPLFALSCAASTLQMPAADQARTERELAGQRRFLRVAAYAGRLWDDNTKGFLTDHPAGEIDLVERPGGKPIPPPAFEKVLPPGTPVRITRIEFPDTFTMAQRVLVTPRFHPWVYLQLEGETRPYVIVVPQEVKTYDDVRVELERYLSASDPRSAFEALPADVRQLVLRKEVAPGMSARALEMAWGLPERKHIDRPAGTEEWSWAGGKRRVYLRDERVERVER